MQNSAGKLSTHDYLRAGLIAIIVALVFGIFHFQGNTTDVRMFSRSALVWMVSRWNDTYSSGADFSYGWLVPVAVLYLVWRKRQELVDAPKSTSGAGLAMVVFALLLLWLGAKAQQTRISLMGLVFLAWGIPYYLCGREVAKQLLFPCAVLILCIPLNFLDSLTFPLRMFATKVAAGLLNGLGISVQRFGSAIFSTVPGGFRLDVADPCSGIRSLMAMTFMAALYSYVTQKTLAKRWALFLLSIPIPVVGNIVRILSVAIASQVFGREVEDAVHEASGYIVFGVDAMVMIALGEAIKMNFSELRERWKQELLSPTWS